MKEGLGNHIKLGEIEAEVYSRPYFDPATGEEGEARYSPHKEKEVEISPGIGGNSVQTLQFQSPEEAKSFFENAGLESLPTLREAGEVYELWTLKGLKQVLSRR